VIVDDLDVGRIAVLPPEANAPLIVDANTVLAGTNPFELLQTVAGRDAKVLEPLGGIDDPELAQHQPLELHWEATDWLAREQTLGVPISEAVDHREE
jgi:hypothetical protein